MDAHACQAALGDDKEARRSAARPRGARRLWLLHRRLLVPRPAHLRGDGAKQVRAHHANRRDDEKPQDGQEGHPDEGKGERVHSVLCPRLLRRCRLGCPKGSHSSVFWRLSSHYLATTWRAVINTSCLGGKPEWCGQA